MPSGYQKLPQVTVNSRGEDREKTIEEEANWFSRLLFLWVTKTVDKAYYKERDGSALQQSDLGELADKDRTDENYTRFMELFEPELEKTRLWDDLVAQQARVEDKKGNKGTLKWVGRLVYNKDKYNYWAGVEWDDPSHIKPDLRGDGYYLGEQHFECRPGHGSFTRPTLIRPLVPKADGTQYTWKDPRPNGPSIFWTVVATFKTTLIITGFLKIITIAASLASPLVMYRLTNYYLAYPIPDYNLTATTFDGEYVPPSGEFCFDSSDFVSAGGFGCAQGVFDHGVHNATAQADMDVLGHMMLWTANLFDLESKPTLGATDNGERSVAEGVFYILIMAFSQLVNSIAASWYQFLLFRMGLHIRAVISAAVYIKTFSSQNRVEAHPDFSVGNKVNLIDKDSERLRELVWGIHDIWAAPVLIAVALFLLYRVAGSATFSAFLGLVILAPLFGLTMAKMAGPIKELAKIKDRRMKKVAEVFEGIRILKYMVWETRFQDQIDSIRDEEIAQLKIQHLWYAMLTGLIIASGTILNATFFFVYVLTGHSLVPSVVWTAQLYFGILRQPTISIPAIIARMIGGRESLFRLARLLEVAEKESTIDDHPTEHAASINVDPDTDSVVAIAYVPIPLSKGDKTVTYSAPAPIETSQLTVAVLAAAAAAIHAKESKEKGGAAYGTFDAAQPPAAKEDAEGKKRPAKARVQNSEVLYRLSVKPLLTFKQTVQIQPNVLNVVVGPTGCGKTTFINTLLGFTDLQSGRVKVNGSIAYAQQEAWLLNATVRQNITMEGLGEDGAEAKVDPQEKALRDAWYATCLDVCELLNELKQFPQGDKTEIGERGINLSGGQKQRIALARAVYANADIVYLDDPLSALDAGTQKRVMERCICGVLKGKTVVLTTHQTQYLHKADAVMVLKPRKDAEKHDEGKNEDALAGSLVMSDPGADDDREATGDMAFMGTYPEYLRSGLSMVGADARVEESPARTAPAPVSDDPNDPRNKPWMGMRIRTDVPGKAVVTEVATGGPADNAGIGDDDVLTSFDGKPVKEFDDFAAAYKAGAKVGKRVPVTLLHNGDADDERSYVILLASQADKDNNQTYGAGAADGSGAALERQESAVSEGAALERAESSITDPLSLDTVLPGTLYLSSFARNGAAAAAQTRGFLDNVVLPEGGARPDVVALEPAVFAAIKGALGENPREAACGMPVYAFGAIGVVELTPRRALRWLMDLESGKRSIVLTGSLGKTVALAYLQGSQGLSYQEALDTMGVPASPDAKGPAASPSASPEALKPTAAAPAADAKLMRDEERMLGRVGGYVFSAYFTACGGWATWPWVLLVFVLAQLTVNALDLWLSSWSSQSFPSFLTHISFLDNLTAHEEEQWFRYVYGTLFALDVILWCVAAFIAFYAFRKAAKYLHESMLGHLLGAPPSFFDTTPNGRILNRFTDDIFQIDTIVPMYTLWFIFCVVNVIGSICVQAYTNYYILISLAVLTVVYVAVVIRYLPSQRETKRMDSINRSPVLAHFNQTLSGTNTIIATQTQGVFVRENLRRLDTSTLTAFASVYLPMYLNIRLAAIGFLIVASMMSLQVADRIEGNASRDESISAMGITYSITLAGLLNLVVTLYSQLEASMASVERVFQYSTSELQNKPEAGDDDGDEADVPQASVPQEKFDGIVPANWPGQDAGIEFDGVGLRYRPGLPLVVRDLSFNVAPGERIGLVGHTGVGKSTILIALFRFVELAHGCIRINGQDIAGVRLRHLRSQLSMVPQDPVLFQGTIRSNIDPFNSASDDEVWSALAKVDMKQRIEKHEGKLVGEITDKGANFSHGERALLCLARALLKKGTRILLIDEATANIDMKTDMLIQRTIREAFAGYTVITIAHRLQTVIDSDRLLVLGKEVDGDGQKYGTLVEHGSPKDLISKKGFFYNKFLTSLPSDEQKRLKSIALADNPTKAYLEQLDKAL